MTQSPGWKQHLLVHPGLSFLRAEAFQGMLHNHRQNTLTPVPPQSRAVMLPENQCSLGTMDPSQGCSSHRLEPLFFPFPAPWPGVSEQGRARVSEGGGLLTPRARSCGCASCSTFLRLRLRLPPQSLRLGRRFSCRVNSTRPGQHPGQYQAASPPRAPPSILGMVQGERSPAQGLCKTSSQALTLLHLVCESVSRC